MDHVISGEADKDNKANDGGILIVQNGHNACPFINGTEAPSIKSDENGDIVSNGIDGMQANLITQEPIDEKNDIIFVRRGAISIENIHNVVKRNDSVEFCEKITRIRQKIKSDELYRNKFWYSVSLIGSFFVLGWLLGQVGPSLLDLQKITNVSMEKASLYVTACCAGYMAGSLVSGYLYDKFNKCILMFTFLCGLGISVVILPWCAVFEAMLLIQFIEGMFQGSIDTVTCAEMVAIWDTKTGQSFMQGLHFGFSIGGIISPLVTAPFLASENFELYEINEQTSTVSPELSINNFSLSNSSHLRDNYGIHTWSFSNGSYNKSTITSAYANNLLPVDEASLLFVAYSISGIVSFLIAIPFMVIYCKTGGDFKHNEKRREKEESRCIPCALKVVIIITMSSMSMLYTGLEETFVEFFSVFVVKKVKWTKTLGSIATSLYFGSIGLGHFINIFVVRVFDAVKLMGVNCLVLVAVMTGLLISSSQYFHVGVWLSCPLTGICLSVIYPIIFTWTEDVFMPVTGRISSIFILTGALGSLVNPIILGLLMEQYTPMWFCYLLLIESILQFICYVIGLVLSRVVRNKYEVTNSNAVVL